MRDNTTRDTWRLFIAINLDAKAFDALEPVDRWLESLHGFRAAPRQHRHLTLAFIGEVNTERQDAVAQLLPSVAAAPAFEAPMRRVICLPSRHRPRIIAVELDASTGLESLMIGAVRTAMEAAPTEPLRRAANRPVTPHITIARARRSRHTGAISLDAAPSPSGRVAVRHVDLIRSTLTPDGPTYDTILRLGLKDINKSNNGG